MSFTFCFDREDDVYQFAYSFPYTYTKLQNYLENIEQRQLDYVQRRPLVYSVVKISFQFSSFILFLHSKNDDLIFLLLLIHRYQLKANEKKLLFLQLVYIRVKLHHHMFVKVLLILLSVIILQQDYFEIILFFILYLCLIQMEFFLGIKGQFIKKNEFLFEKNQTIYSKMFITWV